MNIGVSELIISLQITSITSYGVYMYVIAAPRNPDHMQQALIAYNSREAEKSGEYQDTDIGTWSSDLVSRGGAVRRHIKLGTPRHVFSRIIFTYIYYMYIIRIKLQQQ